MIGIVLRHLESALSKAEYTGVGPRNCGKVKDFLNGNESLDPPMESRSFNLCRGPAPQNRPFQGVGIVKAGYRFLS